MESSRVKVAIFGQTYTIKGDAASDYIVKLADYVNSKMNEVSESIGSGNPAQVAILAAMNIADEFHQLKNISTGSEIAVERKTSELISMLDEGLTGDIFAREVNPRN
jgi:cell division protein ZapA